MDMHFEGMIFQTHAAELERRMRHSRPPFCILDLRSPEAFRAGHIPGSIPTTAEDLAAALPEGTTAETEFFLVGSGPGDPRVREASLALDKQGVRRRVEFPGGIMEWTQFGRSLVKEEPQAA